MKVVTITSSLEKLSISSPSHKKQNSSERSLARPNGTGLSNAKIETVETTLLHGLPY